MKLEIPLSEVRQFLSNQYQIDIDLQNIGENKIKVTYIVSVVLILKEVKEDVILFGYEVHWLTRIWTKMAHFYLMKELNKKHIEWDSKLRELKIDVNKFTELNGFLKFISISEIHFVNEVIVLKLDVKGKI